MDFEEKLMENLGRIELGQHRGGIRNLGLILKQPPIAGPALVGVGLAIGTIGSFVTYHTFDSIGGRKSLVGKIAMVVAGLSGVGLALEGLLFTVAGVGLTVSGE